MLWLPHYFSKGVLLILKLIFLSVASSLCSLLASGYEKYIKYISALLCLGIIIAPIAEADLTEALSGEAFGGEVTSLPENSALPAEELARESAEKYIEEIVFAKFGIKDTRARIVIDWSQTDAVITEITLAVPKASEGQFGEIKAYLAQALGGEVNVVEA